MPTGTGCIDGLKTRSTVSLTGRPIGTERRGARANSAGTVYVVVNVVHSVGP
jgi:hypothetical protein